MNVDTLLKTVESLRDEMTQTLMELIRLPAIAPENGGDGELKKAEKLVDILSELGFDKIERHDAKDPRVPSKKRPNIVTYSDGKKQTSKLWIITHLDIVPPGEESMWTMTKPYEPVVKEGKIYGRGSEDNMQSMIASIYAAKALKDLKIKPEQTLALAFVADEEQGSTYGIQHLIGLHLFKKGDMIIVPDSGNSDGSLIEIAEKSALWFRIRTIGKQTHASRPYAGLNAHRIGMDFALTLDKMLHEKYSRRDKYFDPPESTIEPTRKDRNVDAINIIPGEDNVYFDCRILPNYSLTEVVKDIRALAKKHEKETGATTKFELVHQSIAPKPTKADARVVKMLEVAIKKTRGVKPKVGGIGGGTCAAFFREINIPAVVWSTIDETAHQPNEYAKINNIVEDSKTYALVATMQ